MGMSAGTNEKPTESPGNVAFGANYKMMANQFQKNKSEGDCEGKKGATKSENNGCRTTHPLLAHHVSSFASSCTTHQGSFSIFLLRSQFG